MMITTVTASPKNTPWAFDIRQVPVIVPVLSVGAVIGIEIWVEPFTATACASVIA